MTVVEETRRDATENGLAGETLASRLRYDNVSFIETESCSRAVCIRARAWVLGRGAKTEIVDLDRYV